MKLLFLLIDKLYSNNIGKLILSIIAFIVMGICIINLQKWGLRSSNLLKHTFNDYKRQLKLTITLINIWIICVYNFLIGINTGKIIPLILSNSVFMILAILDNKRFFKDVYNLKELKYLINMYLMMSSSIFGMTTLFYFLETVFQKFLTSGYFINRIMYNLIVKFIFPLLVDVIFGPISLIAASVSLNYLILLFLVKSNFLDLKNGS